MKKNVVISILTLFKEWYLRKMKLRMCNRRWVIKTIAECNAMRIDWRNIEMCMCSFCSTIKIDEWIDEILISKLFHFPCCMWNLNFFLQNLGIRILYFFEMLMVAYTNNDRDNFVLRNLVSVPSCLSHRHVSKWSSYASSWRKLFLMWK